MVHNHATGPEPGPEFPIVEKKDFPKVEKRKRFDPSKLKDSEFNQEFIAGGPQGKHLVEKKPEFHFGIKFVIYVRLTTNVKTIPMPSLIKSMKSYKIIFSYRQR